MTERVQQERRWTILVCKAHGRYDCPTPDPCRIGGIPAHDEVEVVPASEYDKVVEAGHEACDQRDQAQARIASLEAELEEVKRERGEQHRRRLEAEVQWRERHRDWARELDKREAAEAELERVRGALRWIDERGRMGPGSDAERLNAMISHAFGALCWDDSRAELEPWEQEQARKLASDLGLPQPQQEKRG